MIWTINIFLFFTAVFFGVFIFGTIFKSKSQVEERLQEISKMEDAESEGEDILRKPFSERVIQPFVQNLGNMLGNLAPTEIKQNIEKKIIYAGNPRNLTFNTFVLFQLMLGIGLPLLLLSVLRISGPIENLPLLIILLGALGFLIPTFLINSKAAQRQKAIQRSLPDMLDLLLVSVEAGLGFDMALKRVGEKKAGDLSKELNRALEEIRVGKTRTEALRGVIERTGVADIRTFVGAVIQSEQLGSSLARTLSIQADTMRQKRRQRAEEMAMKIPIKMIFPLVFFIFPTLLVVVLGPSAIRIFQLFAGGGDGLF